MDDNLSIESYTTAQCDSLLSSAVSLCAVYDRALQRRGLKMLEELTKCYRQLTTRHLDILLTLTIEAMKSECEQNIFLAIEFWTTLCDEMVSSACLLAVVLPRLVPALITCMENPRTSDHALVCISCIAERTPVLDYVLPYLRNNIDHADTAKRRVAIDLLGSVLEGPVKDGSVQEIFTQYLRLLLRVDLEPEVNSATAFALQNALLWQQQEANWKLFGVLASALGNLLMVLPPNNQAISAAFRVADSLSKEEAQRPEWQAVAVPMYEALVFIRSFCDEKSRASCEEAITVIGKSSSALEERSFGEAILELEAALERAPTEDLSHYCNRLAPDRWVMNDEEVSRAIRLLCRVLRRVACEEAAYSLSLLITNLVNFQPYVEECLTTIYEIFCTGHTMVVRATLGVASDIAPSLSPQQRSDLTQYLTNWVQALFPNSPSCIRELEAITETTLMPMSLCLMVDAYRRDSHLLPFILECMVSLVLSEFPLLPMLSTFQVMLKNCVVIEIASDIDFHHDVLSAIGAFYSALLQTLVRQGAKFEDPDRCLEYYLIAALETKHSDVLAAAVGAIGDALQTKFDLDLSLCGLILLEAKNHRDCEEVTDWADGLWRARTHQGLQAASRPPSALNV